MINLAENVTITMNKNAFTAILVIVAFALGLVIGTFVIGKGVTGSATGSGTGTGNTEPIRFDIPSFAPFLGSDTAKVTIVEFGDYQCPFCERFFTQSEPQIMQNYVDTGKAKFYFLDFQFLGPDSLTLGQGAWCANDQGLYYEYHDYIYSNQGQENSGWATPDKVKTMVANIQGFDVQQFSSCLDSGKYESRVQELTQFGQGLGVSGTPTFFIGDSNSYLPLVGAQPYSVFKQVLDQLV